MQVCDETEKWSLTILCPALLDGKKRCTPLVQVPVTDGEKSAQPSYTSSNPQGPIILYSVVDVCRNMAAPVRCRYSSAQWFSECAPEIGSSLASTNRSILQTEHLLVTTKERDKEVCIKNLWWHHLCHVVHSGARLYRQQEEKKQPHEDFIKLHQPGSHILLS